MGTTWFPPGWAIDSPNPGDGQLFIEAPAHPYRGEALVTEDWSVELAGHELGEFLGQVTTRAFQADTEPAATDGPMPPFVTPAAARAMLPALQQAMIDAIAGTERRERTFKDQGEAPERPYCSRCGEGTLFSPGPLPCEWCDRHGHTPFGYPSQTSWETAQALHKGRRRSWERQQELRESGLLS